MNDKNIFSISVEDVRLSPKAYSGEDWRLLRRLKLPGRLNEPQRVMSKRAAVIDVETTGLSMDEDEVIQLAILPFTYEPEGGRILEILHEEAFIGWRDTRRPISREASLVTGINAETIAGKSISGDAVERAISDVGLMIAHNASFDRVMVEKLWPCFADVAWACSLSSVDWLEEGFSAGKLDYLGMQFGWFYDGHDALADCEACLALLSQKLPRSGERVLTAVRRAAMADDFLIRAIDAPFEARGILKQRGYRWRPQELEMGKVWWTITPEPDAEIAWLRDAVYGCPIDLPIHPITARTRFSERIWQEVVR